MKKNIVSITDFGAVPFEHELQTNKIQEAIDFCFQQGGGIVEIPEGAFYTGGIRIRSNVTIHLLKNAVLKGSKNPKDYFGYLEDQVEPLDEQLITRQEWSRPELSGDMEDSYRVMRVPGSRWNNALIRGINAENISIIGEEGSLLDGCDVFDEKGEEYFRGPHCIDLFNCKNILLKGYTIQNSSNWAHAIMYCENIIAENVTVLAGHDGINLRVCNNIKILNCKFLSGDDCVAGIACVNMHVDHCEMNSTCSAFRLGGTNILVENCHIYGPGKYVFRRSLTNEEMKKGVWEPSDKHRYNMLSVFTYNADYSTKIEQQPGNIVIQNCTVEGVDRFLHYNYSGNEWWQTNRPLQSIHFENIKIADLSMPLVAYGDAEVPLKMELKNVQVSLRKGYEDIDFMHLANCESLKIKNLIIENYKGHALIKQWSKNIIEIDGLVCNLAEEEYVVDAKEKFHATPI